MKQKYKDILKNKWGWTFAAIPILIFLYFVITQKDVSGSILYPIMVPFLWFNFNFGGELFGASPWYSGVLAAIATLLSFFILGLILQWLWRKFK